MLVLTRKTDESIRIGDDIEITVVRISGGKVQIGIQAPRNINVARSEVVIQTLSAEQTEQRRDKWTNSNSSTGTAAH